MCLHLNLSGETSHFNVGGSLLDEGDENGFVQDLAALSWLEA